MPKKNPKVNPFFLETEDYRAVRFVTDMCIEQKETGLIYGSPGVGKTVAIRNLTENTPDAILIECYGRINILRAIAKNLNISPERKGEHLFESIRDYLLLNQIPIFVDEAETLTYMNLEWLRRLQDFSGMPLILVGTETLFDNLMGARGQRRQLYRRVRAKWIMQGLTKPELESVCEQFGYTKPDKIRKIAGNNFDQVVNLLSKMTLFAERNEVDINAMEPKEIAKFIIV